MKSLKETFETIGIKQVLNYIEKDPEKNIPKVLNWVEKLDKGDIYHGAYETIREGISDPNSNWNTLIKSFYTDINPSVRKKIFVNFIVKSAILGTERRESLKAKYDCNIPWAILMDPTSACNLKCIGCWASEYGNKLSMDINTLDKIICQGKELGIYMYIYSGGEPLVRKKDIISLCEKHDDCIFLAFTNGTLIDEDFSNEMLRVCNFIPAISVEGFEAETDMRRGIGTYKAVIDAMNLLKAKELPFGFSTCYHSKNTDVVGSEEYLDLMIEKGAKFGWYFTYMPVGINSPTDLMVSNTQREFMYNRIRKFREEKPVFTMDFWNDGEYVDGCIAGGKCYMHINANGDVEPCAFIHYSNINIKESSLLDSLKSPLFMEYRKNQPFNSNHLRPCPLLDNPDYLKEMVNNSKAKSTDLMEPENVDFLTSKCTETSKRWALTSDELWKTSQIKKCEKCNRCS
ncbi:radical SAM protein [Clostridium paridis]|uniref:Radical SAM protein n=1 Tax=Clostridium paridis TaxID=2803863 RepID=A0A937K396_9CLOT|nr:radical SAM protein [Clostridium paridis]MBL4931422.1 radical SAM protein [Clostridium paridis]